MPSSSQIRNALAYMAVTVLVLVFLNIYSAAATRNLMFKAKCSSSQDKLKVVTSSFSGADSLTQETVRQVISVIGDMNVTRLLVTDAAGRTLYDSVPGQSAAGKVPVGVGRRAKRAGVPCVAVCGCVGPGAEAVLHEGVTAYYATSDGTRTMDEIRKTCREDLRNTARQVIREYI